MKHIAFELPWRWAPTPAPGAAAPARQDSPADRTPTQWAVNPCCPVKTSMNTPASWPLLLMRVNSVSVAPATSTWVKAPREKINPCATLPASMKKPAMSPESLIPKAVVPVARGKSKVVKTPPRSKKPCELKVASCQTPTISPAELMPAAVVESGLRQLLRPRRIRL
jgi:hypothetical protein